MDESAAPRRPNRALILILLLFVAGAAGAAIWWAAKPGDPLAPQATAPTPAPDAPTGVRALDAKAQLAAAFQTVFGQAGESRVTEGDKTYSVTPATIEWIGDTAALVTLARDMDDCHACSGAMGVYYLKPEGDGFAVIGRWPVIVPGSSFGAATSGWTVRRDLASHPVIASEGGFTGQGYTCSWTNLAELAPAAPVLLATVRTGYSDAGARVDNAPATEWDGKIVNPAADQSFDVAFSGSDRFTETWRRDGEVYAPEEPSRLDEHC